MSDVTSILPVGLYHTLVWGTLFWAEDPIAINSGIELDTLKKGYGISLERGMASAYRYT